MADRRQTSDNDSTDTPPYSRVFVIHGKGFNETEFKSEFGKYGEVQDVWMVKNKYTGEEKGVTYIKYAKASEAALAMEGLNQKTIGDHPKPVKVVLASSRDEGSGRDPQEDMKMMRIFVIIPKSYTEDDLRNDFKEYGDIEHVSIIKDRQTGEGKGFGYVTYQRAYHAALALEKCPRNFKAKFAEPKGTPAPMSAKRPRYDDHYGSRNMDRGDYRAPRAGPSRGRNDDYDAYSTGGYSTYGNGGFQESRDMRQLTNYQTSGDYEVINNILNRYGRPKGPVEVEAEIATSNVSTLQLRRLFNLVPGLDSFEYSRNTGIALIRYATPQLAAYACEQLNDFEYPIGYPIRTRLMLGGGGDSRGAPTVNMDNVIDQIQNLRGNDSDGLVQALKQVSTILSQNGGSGSGQNDFINNRVNPDGTCSVRYCNVALPTCRPLSDPNSQSEERLFLVCQPRAIRIELLQDALCRFGNLIDVYLQPGKNFGYARFSDKNSAHRCIEALHGQEINGQRLKVMISDPPKAIGSSGSSSREDVTSKRDERW